MALTEQQKVIETRMRAAYELQAADVLADQDQFKKTGLPLIGIETEYSLKEKNSIALAGEDERNKIVDSQKEWFQPELGRGQIEATTTPELTCDMGIKGMIDQLVSRESHLVRMANQLGLDVIKNGTYPLVPIKKIVRSSKPKYTIVPNFYNNERTSNDTLIGKEQKVDIGDLSIISLFNSIQLNIEAKGPEDSIDLLNRSLAISPTVIALTGNSRFIEGIDTGLNDMRMLAWSKAVDTRTPEEITAGVEETRAGMPDRYFASLPDYLRKVGNYPFILDQPEYALVTGIGMYWRDARIKIIGDSLVVEPRPIPMQPTTEENIAAVLMYLGRLQFSKETREALLPMCLIKQNKNAAMIDGLSAKMWHQKNGLLIQDSARALLTGEICKARAGLNMIGLNKDQMSYLNIIEERVKNGTPSDKFAARVESAEMQGANRTEALLFALQ